ncbi:DUF262 domain-containing protein [Streptomyces mirabilis]|uniref:DUF262 domain-containing protein n=1 Tax=Streptomyces mirabilis TaxID=68239 RepID=UPI00380EE329
MHKVFSSDYDFRIPDYQRPYAWDIEQAVQLLTDLEESLDRGTDEPYFLGSIVLVKAKGNAPAEVIDGQQRLTTLTILLALLRDLTEDPDLRSDLDKLVTEPGNKVRRLDPRPRLTLRIRDAGFFQQYVQTKGATEALRTLKEETLPTDAQKAVLRNAKALHAILADWSEDRRLDLVQMLGERTFLVVVSTPDLDSAHRIFSVMNSRGMDLSPTDIFKSHIIGALDQKTSEECARKWEDAEEALGRDDFADLFLHLRMVFALTSPPAEAGGFFPRGLSFLLLRQQLPRTNGKGRWYAQQSYASSTDLTSRQPGGRPGQLGYRWPDGLQTTSLLRVVGGGRRSALAANRLSLPCSAGVRFLPRLKAGVSTEESR